MTDQAKKRPRQVAAYQSLRLVTVDEAATCGAQIGVNLLLPDGTVGTIATLAKLFGSTGTVTGDSTISTTDDLEEGQWHYWFTDRRAQDAVGAILADTATIDLAYTAGTSITATLRDLADSGAGAALVKLTRDSKGRISGTSAATTTDLTEGSNLYFTDARAQAAVVVSSIADGDTTHSPSGDAVYAGLALKIDATEKAAANGVATLGADAKLDPGQLPALAITDTFVVADEAAMLALVCQQGDVAVRTDLSTSFILTTDNPTVLTNWQELLTPTGGVSSFNGRTGSITPASGDYTFAQLASTPTTLAGYGITDAEPAVTAGTTAQYRRGDKSWQDFAADVRAAVLTGLSTASSAVIAATDTVLGALGKLQAQITANLTGVTDGSNAAAGKIGEYISASIGATSISSGVFTNLLSISLTPGDWDVSGGCGFSGSANNITNIVGGSSSTSATLGPLGSYFQQSGAASQNNLSQAIPTFRRNITATTTVYLVVYAGFPTGTAVAFGLLQARRIR